MTCSVSFGQNESCSPLECILSGVLVTFRQQLAAEFASRNCSYTAAATATEFYIVPRTGVFTTDTRLNTGLRLQRRPELDGDLERELHQNCAQLDAHPVSSVVRSRVVSLPVLSYTRHGTSKNSYGALA